MKSALFSRNILGIAVLLILFGGCVGGAGNVKSDVSPAKGIDLSGTWRSKLSTGANVEILFAGNTYNIKVDGVDNNKGTFSLMKANVYDYIRFEIKENIDKNSNLSATTVRYKIEDGDLVIEGGTYKGTYKKQ